MNYFNTSILSFLVVLFWGNVTQAADLGLSPSSLKLKVYKMAVSASPLCTSLTTIIDNGTTPTEVEFASGTIDLGSGTVADGTYPCVVIEFSSYVKFTPAANSDSGGCSTATEETLDVCSSGSSALIDGTTTTCASSSDDKVAMYLSTASTSTTGSDAFIAPTSLSDASRGFKLTASLTVSGTSSGKFVVNPSGKVCDGGDAGCEGGGAGGTCKLEPPTFSFSQ